ncbi:hypothetical protein MXM51_10460 [Pantoea stewartii]|uniref:hypothetical protein n=1 Tax=Pantoea stewartii TaxID=66269 RepID=UPI002DBEAE7E|nr:hypothetical protein [Pantoea stewartii]MEB6534958.1 hypothetical protein [Pantoea stewartii]
MTVFIALPEAGNERRRPRWLHISSGKGRAKTVKILCLFTLLRRTDVVFLCWLPTSHARAMKFHSATNFTPFTAYARKAFAENIMGHIKS